MSSQEVETTSSSVINNVIVKCDNVQRQDINMFIGFIVLMIGLYMFVKGIVQFLNLESGQKDTIGLATSTLLGLTLFVMALSWILLVKKDKSSNKPPEEQITLTQFLDLNNISLKSVLVGMTQGFVFGTIDNFGMALGIDGIETMLKAKGLENPATIAGLSNLYSSLFGSVMGSCLEKAIVKYSEVDNTPWWGNLVGILFGSLAGIQLSKLVQPKQKN